MKQKKWLWILIAVVLVVAVIVPIICLNRCSKDDDPRETAVVLTKDKTIEAPDKHYYAKVQDGKNGETYVFTSLANEHESDIYVFQAESEESIDWTKYTLKMYNKDYKEISMEYDASNHSIALTNGEKWCSVYEEENVYFAITLKEDFSFKIELRKHMA